MTQDPNHTLSFCPTCQAKRGEPCRRRDGEMAKKVHYGRPEWSAKVGHPQDDWWTERDRALRELRELL